MFVGLDIAQSLPIIKPSLPKCRPAYARTIDISCLLVLYGQGVSTDQSGSIYLSSES